MTRSKAIRFVDFVCQYQADNPDATAEEIAAAYAAATRLTEGSASLEPLVTPDQTRLHRLADAGDPTGDHFGRLGI